MRRDIRDIYPYNPPWFNTWLVMKTPRPLKSRLSRFLCRHGIHDRHKPYDLDRNVNWICARCGTGA